MDQLSYLVELIEEQNAMLCDLQRQVAYLTNVLIEDDDDE
jgi:hypothetical protein